jgi:hypothetical protein
MLLDKKIKPFKNFKWDKNLGDERTDIPDELLREKSSFLSIKYIRFRKTQCKNLN